MAIFFLRIKSFSRATGGRVTRAAAYRAGERIRDERTSSVYDHSERDDVVHKEIVLPSQFDDNEEMNWARDRATLWNAAEHAGRRCNSRLARDVFVVLPSELTPVQRVNLARTFSRELSEKYQNAVDLAVHTPREGSDERNHHAHLLMTTRRVSPEGLGPRTTIELGISERYALGLGPTRVDYIYIRKRWAQITNDALRDAGLAERIDHRSYKDQGIDREPTPMMPKSIYYAEHRSGLSTPAGDEIRARYRERVEARLKGSDELARVVQRQKEEGRQRAIERAKQKEGLPNKVPWSALTRDDLNRRQRDRYHKNLEAERKRNRDKRRAKAPEINERRKQWRHANAEEFNRKQREYQRARAARRVAERALKPKEQTLTKSLLIGSEAQKRPPTAEESAKNWLAFRETQQRTPTAEDSARTWLAFREREKQAETSPSAPDTLSRKREVGKGDDGNDDDPKTKRKRDYDIGL